MFDTDKLNTETDKPRTDRHITDSKAGRYGMYRRQSHRPIGVAVRQSQTDPAAVGISDFYCLYDGNGESHFDVSIINGGGGS